MNQIQRLIDSIRDAPHDTVIVAGMFAIPVLIALWIVNRMRHPERGLLHALVVAERPTTPRGRVLSGMLAVCGVRAGYSARPGGRPDSEAYRRSVTLCYKLRRMWVFRKRPPAGWLTLQLNTKLDPEVVPERRAYVVASWRA